MSNIEVISTIATLREWEAIAAEAAAEVESIKDRLKKHMDSLGAEELQAGTHILRYTTVSTTRLDTGALRKTLPDVYGQFARTSTSRRFTVSD